ncbi:MAG: D-lyxose/D-mannose family sugar isomerase [Coriobacteriales bacterium]|jgi:D-lyxose ketol-isomerase|nr:D-lyxose/D-mannose family sugar isomerase [Coriobacteriales bacterium]
MRRSEINIAIKNMENLINGHRIELPPFCHWTPDEWQTKGPEYDEIRTTMLGWDITDYGMGDFNKTGFSLITLRNGSVKKGGYTKTYAEKLLMLNEGQYAPLHFHWKKMEDIINRGGGNALITVYNSTRDGGLANTDVTVTCDGRKFIVAAGSQIKLTPGESITIQQFLYHDFRVEPGFGSVLLGEVSECNDDTTDNRFYEPIGRFPVIDEDEPPYRLLCNEYPAAREA